MALIADQGEGFAMEQLMLTGMSERHAMRIVNEAANCLNPKPRQGGPNSVTTLPAIRSSWPERGACKGVDINQFFGGEEEGPTGSSSVNSMAIRTYCSICIVQTECLQYALSSPLVKGVWGGTTDRQRKRAFKNPSIMVELLQSQQGETL